MHDNVPSYLSKFTCEFFEDKRFMGEKIIEWPPSNPDLNLIKNLWVIVRRKLYEGCKQYNSKADLWETIKITLLETEVKKINKINGLLAIIEKKCLY